MYPFVQVPIGAGLGLVLLLVAALGVAIGPRFEVSRLKAAIPGVVGAILIVAHFAKGGPLTIFNWPTYGIMLLLGALSVIGIGMRWATARGLRSELIVELGLIGLLCGLVGARAVHVVEQWDVRFADQPAAVRLGTPRTPLAAGEVLRLETKSGAAEVRFVGGEDPAAVAAAINAQAQGIGLEAEVVRIEHRGPEGLESYPRGLLLKTEARGPEAVLRIHGGPAAERFAPRLVLQTAAQAKGSSVPLTKIFDLSGGGLTYFGSVLGVLLSCGLWLRYRKVRPVVILDLMAPVLPLGLFFGRLGCTAFGCCWGRELGSGVPWPGFSFPPGSPGWRQMAEERLSCEFDPLLDVIGHETLHSRGGSVEEILRGADVLKESESLTRLAQEALPKLQDIASGTPSLHPAQLYEGFGVLLVVFALWFFRERLQRRLGQCFVLVFLLQAPLRFAVEHMRRDHGVFFRLSWLDYSFTESQVVAVLFFLGALPVFLWLTLRGEPVSPWGEAGGEGVSPASDSPEPGAAGLELEVEPEVAPKESPGEESG